MTALDRLGTRAFRRRARRKVQAVQRRHLDQELNIVYTPPPNTGKSTGFINNVAEMELDASLLQPHHELRDEAVETAEEQGLEVLDLPAFTESPLSEDEQVADWYDRGMPPREIEKRVDVPDDDPYFSVITDDWDEYDLLVGDVVHSHLDRVVMDRHVAFDDVDIFDKFSTVVSIDEVKAEVDEYLQEHSAPVANLYDLLEADESVRNRVADIARNNDSMHDIPTTQAVKARTSNIVRVLAGQSSHERRIEWEEYDPCITDGIKKIGYRIDDTVTIMSIPMHLRHATTVNFLTATPNKPVIEQFYNELGLASDIKTCLNEAELEKYFENFTIVQLTQYLHPYSSGVHASRERLQAIIGEFEEKVGREPGVISTKKAIEGEYEDIDETLGHFARMIGINEYADEDAVIISGTPHFGDDYVRRVARFCESTATVVRNPGEETYWQEDDAQKIYEHMTENSVFQAMLRVGRSVEGPVDIWVDTSALPDWVPAWRPDVPDTVMTESDSHVDVLEALNEESTVSDLFDMLDYSKRQIYRALDYLRENGYVEVVDTAKYGADVFDRLSEKLKETTVDVDEALTSRVSKVTMRQCQQMQKTEVQVPYSDGTLTTAMGLSQRLPDMDTSDDMQLALGQFR
jgi:DNA-binding transcriptional ArsR family regulator